MGLQAVFWLPIAMGSLLAAQDADKVVADSRLAKDLDQLVRRYGDLGFVGSVLVARDGKVLLARGIGAADLRSRVHNTANTLFELASVTKQFTAAAILRLQEQDKLRLDDPIAKHLPRVPDHSAEITIRHLLTHTSGIPRTNTRGSGDDLEEVVPLFLKGGPKEEPGTRWEYWNQGYALLAGIVERASEKTYVEYCKGQLFRRAGLEVTCFTGDEAPKDAVVAIGKSSRGKPRSALDHPYRDYGYQYRGMGGAVSNVWDLWRWHKALKSAKVLGTASKKELFAPLLENYAMGWRVHSKKGHLVQSHGGGVRGFVCEYRRYPNEDGCVIVLSNDDRAPFRTLAVALEQALFGDEFAMPPEALSKALQNELLGIYRVKARKHRDAGLFIDAVGSRTRARVEWPGTPFPPSVGWIGMLDESLVYFDYRTNTPLLIRRSGDRVVTALELQGVIFVRSPR